MKVERRSQARRGISLIECLVYIAVLAVIVSIGGFTLAKAWDQSRAIQRNADDIERAIHAGERWRADLRRATGPVRATTDADSERITIPTADGEVVYLNTTNEVRLQPKPGAPEIILVPKVKVSHMAPDPREHLTAWRWELELQPSQKSARVRPLFTFEAVPGKESAR
jgi:type II secretory pathway pseudopilin PulG